MKTIKTALEELYGLFVEDSSLAVLILVWVAFTVLAFPRIQGNGTWKAPVMFVGLALLLVENVRRSARK